MKTHYRAAAPPDCDRKTFAAHATARRFPSVLFAMLDRKNYDQIIWRVICPQAAAAFRCDDS